MRREAPTLRRQVIVTVCAITTVTVLAIGFGLSALEPRQAGAVASARRLAPVLVLAFAQAWDRPQERRALLDELSALTGRSAELIDAGAPLLGAAPARSACTRWSVREVWRAGVRLGAVRLCATDPEQTARTLTRLGMLAGIGALALLASLMLARRLTTPLTALARRAAHWTQRAGAPAHGLHDGDGGDGDGDGDGGGDGRGGPPAADRAGWATSRETAMVAQALEAMAAALDERLRRQQALLALAGHELRTPVARVRVLAELARDGVDLEQTHGELVDEIEALAAIVEDVLLAARAELGRKPPRVLSLRRLVERAVGSLPAGLPQEGLLIDVPVELWVEGDAELLTRAVAILIDNAQLHGAPPVELHGRRRGGAIELVVEDHGRGVPLSDRDLIFEPFHRGAASSRGSSDRTRGDAARDRLGLGLGLGLALVRSLAHAHGGSITVGDRASGGGACFVLRLPAASGPPSADATYDPPGRMLTAAR